MTPERMKGWSQSKKKYPVVDVTGDGSKIWCYKEQYFIGTWNVRSMNQGKLEVVKQEMARVNVNILGISELKWTGRGEFNSDDYYIYYCGQESLRRNGVAITVNKRVSNAVQFSSIASDSLRSHEPQHARPPCPSPTPRVHPKLCPLSQWCHPAISSSVVPFSSCPQSFPESGSFQMSQLFTSGSQSIGVSASTSVLPRNTQDWSPLGWTGWISLQSKGLSRVFSNTTVQKHQFFGAWLSL